MYPCTVAYQDILTVQIVTSCPEGPYTGSGILVGAHTVLTAGHVIGCHDGKVPSKVSVLRGKEELAASITHVDTEHDLGVLTLMQDLPDVPRVTLAPPSEGHALCFLPAYPVRKRHCGLLTQVEDYQVGAQVVNLHLLMPVVPGNSGSGLWTSDGFLVGVVTHHSGPMEGLGSSLLGRNIL